MKFRAAVFASLLLLAAPVLGQEDDAERLRIHGSNLLGDRLVPTLVQRWLTDIGYEQVKRRDPSVSRTEIAAVRDGQSLVVEIDKRGTASGLQAIISGDAQISMSARQPNAVELDDAWQLGDLKSPDQEWVLGLDGLVVLVSPDNPVTELSVAQLRDVLAGKTTDWQQLGGTPGRIQLHLLPAQSGANEALAQLLPGSERVKAAGSRHRSPSGVVAAVKNDRLAMGIVGLRSARGMLKPLAIRSGRRAFSPDFLSVGSEDYPLLRRVYFHTGQLITALGRSFAQYVVSPAGQAVVARSQFVSLQISPMRPDHLDAAPDEYTQLARKAERLPMTLRFGKGIDLFDSRSRQDIERLAAYLQRPENSRRRVMLMGFANPQPQSPYQSLFQSQERADYVSSEFLALNMKVVTVRGFGGRMNLLDPALPAARYRNDRVEVWLR